MNKTDEKQGAVPMSGVKINLRMTDEEYKILVSESQRLGSSISYAARQLMFKKTSASASSESSRSDNNHKIMLAAKAMRESFKALCDRHKTLCSMYEESLKIPGNNYSNNRILDGMLNTLVLIQKELNDSFRLMNTQEIHIVAAPPKASEQTATVAESAEKVKRNLDKLLNYFYMEKAIITGYLDCDARKFTSQKTGAEKVGFAVIVSKLAGGKTYQRKYDVTALYDEFIFGQLKKGSHVTVIGNFDYFVGKRDDGSSYSKFCIEADEVSTEQ